MRFSDPKILVLPFVITEYFDGYLRAPLFRSVLQGCMVYLLQTREIMVSDVNPEIQELMTNFMPLMHSPTVPALDIAPDLSPRIMEFDLENNCRQLADEGYTVVENAAPQEFFDRLRKIILEKANPYGSLLADKDPVFAEAALNPKLCALAEFSVGGGFLLSNEATTVREPNDSSMNIDLHADQAWVPAPFPEHNLFLTCCWATDDFSLESGATMVVPGSHRHRRMPTMKEVAEKKGAIAIECPAGSVAVWDGSLWHGNWPRTIPGQRVVLHVSYTRLMMRPMESYPVEIEQQLVAEHGSGMAQLLGRHDFLGKPEGKSDFQKFYNAIANSRA